MDLQVTCISAPFRQLLTFRLVAEPHTGFHVAFKMLDADGDEMVEKTEFFKVRRFQLFGVYHKTPGYLWHNFTFP